MDIKKNLNDVKHAVKDTIANVRDAERETTHRANADAERSRREFAGDTMTPREKIESGAGEVKERVQAEVDKGKRVIRSNT
jgi:hypothetical protein